MLELELRKYMEINGVYFGVHTERLVTKSVFDVVKGRSLTSKQAPGRARPVLQCMFVLLMSTSMLSLSLPHLLLSH